jgi:CheY-like chemotaxis protein
VADGKVVFKWMCGKDVPDYVLGDDHRLNQILMNVVGNALKFTEQGYVNVYCNMESETEEVIYVRFTIEDSGIGIPEDQLENIFEPFKQVSGEANRKYAGTGLGLTIVKDLVELQGGVVNVKSAPGLGTTFQIIIPAQRLKPESVSTVHELLPRQTHNATTKVLLVEDHELNRQLAFKLISDFGFEVQLSHNGKDAIERVKSNRYDIILMDLQMPEVDGYAATKYMRDRLRISTPIVAVTAHSAKGEREKCIDLGMNDYLTKPYRAQELYNVIVRHTQQEAALEATTIQISEDQPLKTLASGDRKFELEILELMIKGIPEDVEHLHHAFTVRDAENTRSVAHRLKSTFALAGLNALSEAAESIQIQAIHSEEDWNSVASHVNTIEAGQAAALKLLEGQRNGLG